MIKFKIDKVHGMVIAYYDNGKDEFVDSLHDVASALCNKNNIYIEYNDLINKTMEEVVVYVGRAKLLLILGMKKKVRKLPLKTFMNVLIRLRFDFLNV